MMRPEKTLERLLNNIRRRWQDQGLTVQAGASDAQLADFERKYRVKLPDTLRTLLKFVDGMADGDVDDDLYCFWPISDIKTVGEICKTGLGPAKIDPADYENYFVFADYCISAWDYAIELDSNPNNPGPVYRVFCEPVKEKIAESFFEFLQMYAEDPNKLA